KVKLGKCKLIEEVMIGEDTFIHFSGVARGQACTIVIRAATLQILDEAQRSLHDALCVLQQTLKDPRTIYGGGSGEMLMARAVQELAETVSGKENLAIEALAIALRKLPTIIADNAGYDSAELISQLRALHSQNKHNMGLNMQDGCVGDMEKLGVKESLRVKLKMLTSAVEAAEMLLRVDNIIKAAPRPRSKDDR
ncbi:TCP-1/cpn60 chaperonin family protein, partial [Salmonella sp. s51228]|uniref:TCP-1/cpn60 chaperonin family protein n=1 Tax=Salmonella sp. s51228 TaxID=3159652 RepID=UPI0039815A47